MAFCTAWIVCGVKAVGARLYPHSKHVLIFWKVVFEQVAAVTFVISVVVLAPVRNDRSLSAEHAFWHCGDISDCRGTIEAVAVYADGINIQTEGGVVFGTSECLLKPNVKAEARRNERRIAALNLFERVTGGRFFGRELAKAGS
jgi:hypothetical protein